MRKLLIGLTALAVSTSIVYLAINVVNSKATEAVAAPLPPSSSFPFVFEGLAKQAVFKIMPYRAEREYVGTGGTGFLITGIDGGTYILTNRHICEIETNDRFFLAQQGRQLHVITKIRVSSLTDLCLLKPSGEIVATRIPFVVTTRKLKYGDPVAVYGHPLLRPLTLSFGGYVSELREPMDIAAGNFAFDPVHIALIGKIDFMVQPGNSGSPLIDRTGQVVGIIFAMEGPERNGLFIPSEEIVKFVNTLE